MSYSTPLNQVLDKQEEKNPSGFGELPQVPQQNLQPVTQQQPQGVGQGISMPEKKEFFGGIDYKNVLVVFAIILFVCSGIFMPVVKSVVPGSFSSDNSPTLVSSLISAFIGTIIYLLVTMFVIKN